MVCIVACFTAQAHHRIKKILPPCGGVERWDIKVLTDSDVTNVNFIPVPTTVDSLINIIVPNHTSGTPRMAGIEDQVYKIRCHITIKKIESDDDYHLVVSDTFGNTMIVEVPDPLCSSVSASAYVNQFISARTFVDTNIAVGNVYNVNLPDVEITGVSFADIEHGQTGAAPNQMELHPVLDIQFAPTIGINELPEGLLSVNVSPNPAHDKIFVAVHSKESKLKKCEFLIYNMQGTEVIRYPLPVESENSISTSLNTTHLPNAVYIYRITSNGKFIYDGTLTIQ